MAQGSGSDSLSLAAAREASELLHGMREVGNGSLPQPESEKYMRERFAISGAMVARVTELTVVDADTELGYRFSEEPPSSISSAEELKDWVQSFCHGTLDDLIASEPQVCSMSRRWLRLYRGGSSIDDSSPMLTRRQNISFDGSVYEPYAWLGIANIAAKYVGQQITPEQAMPYVLSRLAIMQQSARQDVARQDIRSAIFQATSAFGEMHSPDDPVDRDWRYSVLLDYVNYKVGHLLVAKRFGNLYRVQIDPVTGVEIKEREEGFGKIKPKRINPVDCAASFRLRSPETGMPSGHSALFKLLRAGIQALGERNVLVDALSIPRAEDTGEVARMLTERLQKEGHWPADKTVVVVKSFPSTN